MWPEPYCFDEIIAIHLTRKMGLAGNKKSREVSKWLMFFKVAESEVGLSFKTLAVLHWSSREFDLKIYFWREKLFWLQNCIRTLMRKMVLAGNFKMINVLQGGHLRKWEKEWAKRSGTFLQYCTAHGAAGKGANPKVRRLKKWTCHILVHTMG